MRGRTVARLAAIATVAVTFGALDSGARNNFAIHMTQHMLLMVVVAPLVVIGWTPRRVPRWSQGVGFALLTVLAGAVALAVWHIPAVFDTAATNTLLHALEHLTLFGVAWAGWWVIIASPAGAGVRLAACAGTAAPMLLLGALLTFAPHPWYVSATLVQQQTGGAIMWGPAGISYVVVAAWIVGAAIVADERFTASHPG